MRKRWIQDPTTYKLIPADEYERPRTNAPAVSGDIEPFVSSVDGTLISSRRSLREHNKRHNVVTAAEYGGHVDPKAAKRIERFMNGEHTPSEKLARKQEIYETIQRAKQ